MQWSGCGFVFAGLLVELIHKCAPHPEIRPRNGSSRPTKPNPEMDSHANRFGRLGDMPFPDPDRNPGTRVGLRSAAALTRVCRPPSIRKLSKKEAPKAKEMTPASEGKAKARTKKAD